MYTLNSNKLDSLRMSLREKKNTFARLEKVLQDSEKEGSDIPTEEVKAMVADMEYRANEILDIEEKIAEVVSEYDYF